MPTKNHKNSTIKVLTVYYKHKPGGFCKRLRFKIEAFLENGWKVHYIAVEPFPYSHPNLIPHILPTPMSNHESLFFWVYFFSIVPAMILWLGIKNNINLITTGSPLYTFFCGPAKLFLRVPILTLILIKPCFHAKWKTGFGLMQGIEQIIEKLGLRWSNIALANSWGSGDAWKNLYAPYGKCIEILPSHIEASNFSKSSKRQNLLTEFSLDPKSFIICHTGLLQKRKNQECIIKALAEINDKNAVLLLIGEGEEKESLRELAESIGVKDQVLFTGWRKDAIELVQGSDLFVFPSYQEGMADSLLEATACQLPCIVSSIPENTDVIRNPEQHFPPDNPKMLAEKIMRLMHDSKYYQNLCDATNEEKGRFVFDWKKILVQKATNIMQKSFMPRKTT